jgi:hypothetical protein
MSILIRWGWSGIEEVRFSVVEKETAMVQNTEITAIPLPGSVFPGSAKRLLGIFSSP